MGKYKWSNRSISRMKGVNEMLIDCATKTLSECELFDYSIPWRGGVRTGREQNEIFEQGNSRCDGYKKKSYHQSGNALDIVPICSKMQEDRAYRYFASKMLKNWQLGVLSGKYKGVLVWGGVWTNFIDKPHWQINI